MEIEEYQYDYFQSYKCEEKERMEMQDIIEQLRKELESVKKELSQAYEIIIQQEEE